MSSEPNSVQGYSAPQRVEGGPFDGWYRLENAMEAFEKLVGPYYFKVENGVPRSAFEPESKHQNGFGKVHGGALMSFVDFALIAIAYKIVSQTPVVTLNCHCDFISPGAIGPWIEAKGEVLNETRSMVFVRGVLTQEERIVLAFSGTLKKVRHER